MTRDPFEPGRIPSTLDGPVLKRPPRKRLTEGDMDEHIRFFERRRGSSVNLGVGSYVKQPLRYEGEAGEES